MLTNLLKTISDNKEWIFSGLGVFAISGLIAIGRSLIRAHSHRHPVSQMNNPVNQEHKYFPGNIHFSDPDQEFLKYCSIRNHALLLKILKSVLDEKSYLVWIDIDQFTQLNKAFGRECGDAVIRTILMIIGSVIRECNEKVTVYHANNRDEFFIIGLDSIHVNLVEMVVSEIHRYEWGKIVPDMFVTCSAGIASYKKNSTDTLKRARVSLNLAKTNGGNRIGPIIQSLHPYQSVLLMES